MHEPSGYLVDVSCRYLLGCELDVQGLACRFCFAAVRITLGCAREKCLRPFAYPRPAFDFPYSGVSLPKLGSTKFLNSCSSTVG
jgi:hypothetical protein